MLKIIRGTYVVFMFKKKRKLMVLTLYVRNLDCYCIMRFQLKYIYIELFGLNTYRFIALSLSV